MQPARHLRLGLGRFISPSTPFDMCTCSCCTKLAGLALTLADVPNASLSFSRADLVDLVGDVTPSVAATAAAANDAEKIGDCLTVRGVSQRTGLSETRVRDLIRETDPATGQSPSFPNAFLYRGRRYLVPESDVQSFLERERSSGAARRVRRANPLPPAAGPALGTPRRRSRR